MFKSLMDGVDRVTDLAVDTVSEVVNVGSFGLLEKNEVKRLANTGLTIVEIAAATDLSVQAIDLILSE